MHEQEAPVLQPYLVPLVEEALRGAERAASVGAQHDAVAQKISAAMGKRVSLHYEEKVGLPTSCFGDTRYFVTRIVETPDIPLGPGVSLPTQPAAPASAASN